MKTENKSDDFKANFDKAMYEILHEVYTISCEGFRSQYFKAIFDALATYVRHMNTPVKVSDEQGDSQMDDTFYWLTTLNDSMFKICESIETMEFWGRDNFDG